jgi:aminoglycoside phosphotransferase (APT) family kinase protein
MMLQITLDLDRLSEYVSQVLECPGKLRTLQVSQFAGGETGARLYRLDLDFHLADGGLEAISAVQKYSSEREVRVMQALGAVPETAAVPATIACGESMTAGGEGSHWFVTPLYEGTHLTFEDEVPRLVVDSLARVHAHFAARVDELGWLPRMDGRAVRRAFDAALESLRAAQGRRSDPLLARAHRALASASTDPVLSHALEALPVTLVHGDVHPWNIVCLPDGGSVLIDWGNAQVAPGMLDLANLVEIDSLNWATYLSAWEKATGEAMEGDLARLGYHWATTMINLQYLLYVAGQWPEDPEAPAGILGMVERLHGALGRLPELLRPS